jgi:hypothetical protein
LTTAYLTDQISHLEAKTGSLGLNGTVPKAKPHVIDDPNFPPLGTEGPVVPRVQPRKVERHDVEKTGKAENGMKRIDDSDDGMVEQVPRPRRRGSDTDMDDEEEEAVWKVIVLDVSALMWAPQSVRRLVRRGWEIVVPLDGE